MDFGMKISALALVGSPLGSSRRASSPAPTSLKLRLAEGQTGDQKICTLIYGLSYFASKMAGIGWCNLFTSKIHIALLERQILVGYGL